MAAWLTRVAPATYWSRWRRPQSPAWPRCVAAPASAGVLLQQQWCRGGALRVVRCRCSFCTPAARSA
jgi:hypothetical protein